MINYRRNNNSNVNNRLSRIERILRNNDLGNLGAVKPINGVSTKEKNLGNSDDIMLIEQLLEKNQSNPRMKKTIFKFFNDSINKFHTDEGNKFLRNNEEEDNMNIIKEARLIYGMQKDKLITYVAAILDPEYCYNNGVMIKQPNLVTIPSVTIPIRTLATVPTNGSSSLCVSWNPSLFCTKSTIGNIKVGKNSQGNDVFANKVYSTLYSIGDVVDNVVVTPASSWEAPVFGIPDNLVEAGVAKARLVSAKIKISFRGPILQQGGTVMGAATFLGPPGVIAHSNDTNAVFLNQTEIIGQNSRTQVNWSDLFKLSQGQLYNAEMTPFEEKNISNGIWSKNVNITKTANGISAVFVPMDPMDEIFYKTGTFYGEEVNQDVPLQNGDLGTIVTYSDKGARLAYLFNVQGIPIENNPITIETYTNWEVLPTDLAASALRNFSNVNLSVDEISKIKEMLKQYFVENSGIHTTSPQSEVGFLDLLGKLGKSLVEKAIEKLAS